MKRKGKKARGSIPAAMGLGVLVGWCMTLVLSLALALMIVSKQLPESSILAGAVVILLLSSFCGSLAAVWTAGEKAMLVGAATGAVYCLTLLCMTALVFGGQYQMVGYGLIAALAGGIGAAFTKLRPAKKRKTTYSFR